MANSLVGNLFKIIIDFKAKPEKNRTVSVGRFKYAFGKCVALVESSS